MNNEEVYTERNKCPCGQIPENFVKEHLTDGGARAVYTASCCSQWIFEAYYNHGFDGPERTEMYAIEAWNSLPREKEK